MQRVQTNVSTTKSPQEVYDYLVDFSNQVEWRYNVLESELVDGQTGRVGARYRQRVKQGPKEMVTHVELARAEPPRTVAFRTVGSGPVSASGTSDIREADGGARVTTDVEIEMRGIMRLFEPMMGPSMRKTAARYEQALTERLRSSAGGPSAPAG